MKILTKGRVARSTILTAVAACGFLIVGTLPAYAATTTGKKTIAINCNSSFIATGITVKQSKEGNFAIKQVSSSPGERTKWWALNTTTNADLSNKTASDGGTVTWTDVVPGEYQVKAVIASSQQCSTYKATYTVTYQ
jgi:hypothetical protein